jgi:methyl-accepting chemotaxis protein
MSSKPDRTDPRRLLKLFDAQLRHLDLTAEAAIAVIHAHPEHSQTMHSLIGALGNMHVLMAEIRASLAAIADAVDPIAELRAEFAEAMADGASSNDIAQLLDDWLVKHGQPTVLYA